MSPEIAVIDADCEAFGHPTECEEPAPGYLEKTGGHGITVTAGGITKEIATKAQSNIRFDSHSHAYNDSTCEDDAAHDLSYDGEPTIKINGSSIYLVEDNVTSDPKTGGRVDIVDNPMATANNKSP
jgi:hypothetical protein